jgi:hypothetical protein
MVRPVVNRKVPVKKLVLAGSNEKICHDFTPRREVGVISRGRRLPENAISANNEYIALAPATLNAIYASCDSCRELPRF